jgi:hypothetical protein
MSYVSTLPTPRQVATSGEHCQGCKDVQGYCDSRSWTEESPKPGRKGRAQLPPALSLGCSCSSHTASVLQFHGPRSSPDSLSRLGAHEVYFVLTVVIGDMAWQLSVRTRQAMRLYDEHPRALHPRTVLLPYTSYTMPICYCKVDSAFPIVSGGTVHI